MRDVDLIDYCQRTTAGLHTESGIAENVVTDIDKVLPESVKVIERSAGQDEKYFVRLNINKDRSDNYLFDSYSEYESQKDNTLEDAGIEGYQTKRADMAFNTGAETDFDRYSKLNRLLISCIAECYKVYNSYKSIDLWSEAGLSVAIKNDRIEVENYNKLIESEGASPYCNRLELRSKKITKSVPEEFLTNWSKRLDKSLEQFQNVQNHYNRELIRTFREDQKKPKRERKYASVTAFIVQHSDRIFTRNQLINLLENLDIENAPKMASNIKHRHKIEFFNQKDLKILIHNLKEAMNNYFSY